MPEGPLLMEEWGVPENYSGCSLYCLATAKVNIRMKSPANLSYIKLLTDFRKIQL